MAHYEEQERDVQHFQPGEAVEKGRAPTPDQEVDSIISRLWNREEATSENALKHDEALVLLIYGKDAGEQMVRSEIEEGRYVPSEDAQILLTRKEQEKAERPPIN